MDVVASFEDDVYIPSKRLKMKEAPDHVKELPDELKKFLRDMFNWNWAFIADLKFEVDRRVATSSVSSRIVEGERDLIYRLDWWLHLFSVEPKNPNLSGELWRLVHRFRAIGLLKISDMLREIGEYNEL